MTEDGYSPDNAGIEGKPPIEPATGEQIIGEPILKDAAFLEKARAYNEAAARTHDDRVDIANDPYFNHFKELMEAKKGEFKHMEIPPEIDLYVDKMLFESKIKKLEELRRAEPERAVGTAVMAMTDFLAAHPDQNLADLGMTSAKAVAKATESNGVIPAPALGFVYEMFRLKAASQAAPTVAESGAGK